MNEAQPNREASVPAGQAAMNPTALAVSDAARLLSAAGGQMVSAEMIQTDIAAGAPVNPDGTINLVHLAAWLVKEMSARGD